MKCAESALGWYALPWVLYCLQLHVRATLYIRQSSAPTQTNKKGNTQGRELRISLRFWEIFDFQLPATSSGCLQTRMGTTDKVLHGQMHLRAGGIKLSACLSAHFETSLCTQPSTPCLTGSPTCLNIGRICNVSARLYGIRVPRPLFRPTYGLHRKYVATDKPVGSALLCVVFHFCFSFDDDEQGCMFPYVQMHCSNE